MSVDVQAPLAPGAPRGGSGAMFDGIADRYDLLNRIISLGIDQRWRRKTVRSLGEPKRILDVATGTADLAILAANIFPKANIVGTDPSVKMLEVGERKVEKAGLSSRITLAQGSAEQIDEETDSFDGATIAFGIRNVPDRQAGLREMARVVRPGGRIAILELGEPRTGLMGPLARFHIHTIVPVLGGLLSGSKEYKYLQRSIAAFPEPDEFTAVMESAGLEVIEVVPFTFGVCPLYVGQARKKA